MAPQIPQSGLDSRRLALTMTHLCRTDFSVFVQGAFKELHDEPFMRNWHINAIAHRLSKLSQREVRRLIITMPPRTMKSFIASVCFPAFLLGRTPSEKVICASYSQDLSREFASQMRKLMQSQWYRRIFPNTRLDSKKTGLDEVGTTHGGFRLSTSTGGTLTGRGGNFIIIDDALKAKDAHSDVARESAASWFRGTVLSRLNNPKSGCIVVVGQRLHMEDLPGQLLTQDGWDHLSLSLEADQDQEIEVSDQAVMNRLAGDVLHADRFGPAEIALLREAMGERDFEAQYNQRPLPPGGALFKLQWLQRYDTRPPVHKVQGIFQSWDTAYEVDGHNDYSVCTTWALSGKHYYLLDVYRERLPFHALEKAVYRLREKYAADLVIVEKAGSGISLLQNIGGNAGKRWLHGKDPIGAKQDRASQQTPKFERGEIWVPREAPWVSAFEDELRAFPHGKHDDQVDSVVQFLAAADTGMMLRLAERARRW